jgi:very-short-patch-repair endonuclease
VKKLTTQIFVDKCIDKYGDKFDYCFVKYINQFTKIKIICKIHGEFEQTPNTHIRWGKCPKCNDKKTKSIEQFIDSSNIKHNKKYSYELVEYKNNKTKVKIICPEHGIFEQTPLAHLRGQGCKKCSIINQRKSTFDFITESNIIHGEYDYSLVKYVNVHKKVKIKCKKHGIFEQSPNRHLRGDGCPLCRESKGEKKILKILENNNIKFIRQKKFEGCKNIRQLPFDFYLPDLNLCIEFDGRQHYESVQDFGGDISLGETQKRDKIKTIYCEENNIKLLRIKYNEKINDKLCQII